MNDGQLISWLHKYIHEFCQASEHKLSLLLLLFTGIFSRQTWKMKKKIKWTVKDGNFFLSCTNIWSLSSVCIEVTIIIIFYYYFSWDKHTNQKRKSKCKIKMINFLLTTWIYTRIYQAFVYKLPLLLLSLLCHYFSFDKQNWIWKGYW